MSAAWVWIPTIFLSFLTLYVTASPSCDKPFRGILTVVTNGTYPASDSLMDPDLVFYRETLCFTDEEIDREREAAIELFQKK